MFANKKKFFVNKNEANELKLFNEKSSFETFLMYFQAFRDFFSSTYISVIISGQMTASCLDNKVHITSKIF